MAHAATVRSPHAHARIVSIDTTRAKALPGVIGVFTGADLATVVDPCPSFASPPVTQRAMAIEKVRHVGEVVAAIVAVDRYVAEDVTAAIVADRTGRIVVPRTLGAAQPPTAAALERFGIQVHRVVR
jgi:CO/xanthine dehydrogenase Mo-binding subunit